MHKSIHKKFDSNSLFFCNHNSQEIEVWNGRQKEIWLSWKGESLWFVCQLLIALKLTMLWMNNITKTIEDNPNETKAKRPLIYSKKREKHQTFM